MKSYTVESRNALIFNHENKILEHDIIVHRLFCGKKEYIRIGPAVFEIKEKIKLPAVLICLYRKYEFQIVRLAENFECSIETLTNSAVTKFINSYEDNTQEAETHRDRWGNLRETSPGSATV